MAGEETFDGLLGEVQRRVLPERAGTFEGAADQYELAGAMDLLRKYLAHGEAPNLENGIERLERIFGRRKAIDREWARLHLPRLREIGLRMDRPARAAAFVGSVDRGRPDGDPSTLASPRRNGCDVLVVAALYDPELTQFVQLLANSERRVERWAGSMKRAVYFTGALSSTPAAAANGLSVVAVFQDRMGMVDCAAVTTAAVIAFEPALVAMVGVCAGRAACGVQLCDLIVPREVFTYDTGMYTEKGFEKEPQWLNVSERITQHVAADGKEIVDGLRAEIEIAYPGDVYAPSIRSEVMACGSSVVNREGLIDEIAGANRKVVGVDMESYAVLRAVRVVSPQTPAFVVKGVMDLGSNKVDRSKRLAAFWAASFAARFIARNFSGLVWGD